MKTRPFKHLLPILLVCLLFSCGMTALAAELYPADVQTITGEGERQIIKTYILTDSEDPADIPRIGFTRDGWRYALTDITQQRVTATDARPHTETVSINTDTDDMNTILALLTPTMDYQAEDGFCGLISLDLASVQCEPAGYKKSSYTVSATREYPHLSTNDLSLIPKTITDNGRTLELDGVSWEVQHAVNVDYQDIPDSYRAVATYTAKASKSTVTGYVTTADYTGEIAKTVTGETVYTVYFLGTEINLSPTPSATDAPPTANPPTESEQDTNSDTMPVVPLLVGVALSAALLAGGGVYLFLRHNVKVYAIGDTERVLVAKVRISTRNPTIDLTPLSRHTESECFSLEIDKLTAKKLNDRTVTVVFGTERLQHRIAYEGNLYRIEADFRDMTIEAVY